MDKVAVDIDVVEQNGISRNREGLERGVPFAQGQLTNTESLVLVDLRDQSLIPMQSSILTRWPDGSIKWLLLEFAAVLKAYESARFHLKCAPAAESHVSDMSIFQDADSVTAANSLISIRIDKRTATVAINLFSSSPGNDAVLLQPSLTLNNDTPSLQLHIDEVNLQEGSFRSRITLRGVFRDEGNEVCLHYQQRVQLDSGSREIGLDTTLHNTRSARHPGGFWDLGDARSVFFNAFSVKATLPGLDSVNVRATPDSSDHQIDDPSRFSVYQDSSGGEQWNHRNHVNHLGEVPVRFRGYQMTHGEQIIEAGYRANPIVSATGKTGTLTGTVPGFWKNFPSAIDVTDDSVCFDFFPGAFADRFELQPGEKKSHSMRLSWAEDDAAGNDALRWVHHPLCASVSAEQLENSRAIANFTSGTVGNPLETLINRSISGPGNFFEKRELVDEFGWRNFGDIVADHESLYQVEQGGQPFVSHYNNQYDAIFGFGFQFLRTGDATWFELMDDLANHVAHIDIYDTHEDRPEFNGGLFWHTDHYLDAATSSHRTYSRQHVTDSTNLHDAGGGPGSEHCYATGLMVHHLLTGSRTSHDAVMSLARWMYATYVGAPGLLSQLDSLRKNELRSFKRWLRGDKSVQHRYPLSRATGNYINVLLDAHELSGEAVWLERAEAAISATVHPDDDLAARALDNIEANWSYIVLLNSVSRYLEVKQTNQIFDDAYYHARASLLHYAHWMVKEEALYLSDLSRIEYPNETWVAQEIRKVNVLHMASLYDQENAGLFRQRAQEFQFYLLDTLSESATLHFARIQAILLQNYPVQNAFVQNPSMVVAERTRPRNCPPVEALPELTLISLASSISRTVFRGLSSFSPRSEYQWVMARLVSRARQ